MVVSRLADWPGPPLLATDIGLQLLPPQVGLEAIVVMTGIASRRQPCALRRQVGCNQLHRPAQGWEDRSTAERHFRPHARAGQA